MPAQNVVWIPSHCKEHHIGTARLGDGSLLTATDLMANAEAAATRGICVDIPDEDFEEEEEQQADLVGLLKKTCTAHATLR